MNDFEHMKTSLYLTDVVVRHEGDTVNFFVVLRSPRGEKQYRPRGIPLESLRVGKLEKPTANPGRRPVMELASAALWMVMTVPASEQPS